MTEKKQILVADDDDDVHHFCDTVLASRGYEIVHAWSGDEARAAASRSRPDAIVLDVMMEVADAGFETARWFAREMPDVPVLLLSSIADASDGLFDTTTLGLADMANKPIDPTDLLARIGRMVARKAGSGRT